MSEIVEEQAMKRVSTTVKMDVYVELYRLRGTTGKPIGDLVREAIDEWLRRYSPKFGRRVD